MKISFSGTLNRMEGSHLILSTDITSTQIPASWFVENITGYLQAIHIKDSGLVSMQIGRTPRLPENPFQDMLTLTDGVKAELCIDLNSNNDIIRCHRNTSFTNNALLGLWSTRRKEGDPIEIVLEDRS